METSLKGDESTGKVFSSLISFLHSSNCSFDLLEHEPTCTSSASAAARGTALDSGAKALLLVSKLEYFIFVIQASRRLNSKSAKHASGRRKIRFATKEELWELAGLLPGSLPPFGRPIVQAELFIDNSIEQIGTINFNAGLLRTSVSMETRDYMKISNPTSLGDFSDS